MFALTDNINKYEANFGVIQQKTPQNAPQNGNNGEIPNPFMMGGKA